MNAVKSLCAFVLIALCLSSLAAKAQDTPASPIMTPLTFMGRWDLRKADRAITINSGSSVRAHFSGTSISALFDISLNKPDLPTLTWRIDNGPWQDGVIASRLDLADHLPDGEHTLWLMVRGTDQRLNRWTAPLIASVTFLGVVLPDGATLLPPLDEWVHPKLAIEFLGDSITEGVSVNGPHTSTLPGAWSTDALHSWACLTATGLGASWRQVGFGYTGLARKGNGGVPGALSTFNFFSADCPRDDWQPDLVVINQGTNEAKMEPAAYAELYTQYLKLIRTGYPQAKIAALRPFNGSHATEIKKCVDDAVAAGDSAIFYIDTTGWYSGGLHPGAAACPAIAAKLIESLKARVLP